MTIRTAAQLRDRPNGHTIGQHCDLIRQTISERSDAARSRWW
ncbi:MAG: hypothetical protein ACRDS9_09800 [Pseudonocardiaceae bacterium]